MVAKAVQNILVQAGRQGLELFDRVGFMLKRARVPIEAFFYRRGIKAPELLALLSAQSLLVLASALAGLLVALLSGWNLWLLYFALGAALALFNFWGLANFTMKVFDSGAAYSKALALRQFFSFLFRFALTAALLIFFRNAIIPIVAGLSSFVLLLTLYGLARVCRLKT